MSRSTATNLWRRLFFSFFSLVDPHREYHHAIDHRQLSGGRDEAARQRGAEHIAAQAAEDSPAKLHEALPERMSGCVLADAQADFHEAQRAKRSRLSASPAYIISNEKIRPMSSTTPSSLSCTSDVS